MRAQNALRSIPFTAFTKSSMTLNNFVIVCMGRTGSAWLLGLLNSHPEIHCGGEWFHAAYRSPIASVMKRFLTLKSTKSF